MMASSTASAAPTTQMTGRTSRACNGCRFRKVRCNGSNPCSQCEHLNLACEFSTAPTKRKPAVRGRLVAQLRDKAKTTSPSDVSPPSTGGDSRFDSASSPYSSDYPVDFFMGLVDDFERVVYPFNPVISPAEMRVAIENMHVSHQDAALVYSFAAVTINLTHTSWVVRGETAAQMTDLMHHAMTSHRQADLAGIVHDGVVGELSITVKRAVTCIFLEISMMAFKCIDRCFSILREAIGMVETLNTQLLNGECGADKSDICRRQRLYWEAFIHERFMTIVSGKRSILPPLRTGFPYTDPSIPPHVDLGFSRLIQLFYIIDDAFLAHWNAQQDPGLPAPTMTAQWIESKQAQLDQDEINAAEAERALSASGRGTLTEIQHADLFVTRLWMRTLVWQLALSQGLLRSAPPQTTHQGLSLHFPVERLSAQLRSLVNRLDSVASIGIHGSGIMHKLFEITSTIADVLALPQGPGQSQEDARARMEDFVFLVKFLFNFDRTQKQQREYLREKLEVLQPMYTVVDFADLAGSPT
ncbi:putative C6 transcription factor [Dactylonectria macrodidyma]|uniref:C6 transcription factor n=1 Tax=Dactylonectria macrodidyma TaxID=307937 RepID=A0A9P9JGX0_9HYPO|nr:putative C6 transcription factor [Dactylonectria macrodidyma]